MLRYLLPALLVSTACFADQCPQPIFQGMTTGALMRFVGETGNTIYSEHGTIETFRPRHVFNFTTTHSNGFAREYLTLSDFPEEKVSSPVLRKKADFTSAQEPGAFLITPDLPVDYYYATNQPGQEDLHQISLDDTWKLIGCGPPNKKSDLERQMDATEAVRRDLRACWTGANLSFWDSPGSAAPAVSVRFNGLGDVAEIKNATLPHFAASAQEFLYGNPIDRLVSVARSCHITLDADQRAIMAGKSVVIGYNMRPRH